MQPPMTHKSSSRGRTTTGMVAASLIATVASRDVTLDLVQPDDAVGVMYDRYDGYEEAAYMNGEPGSVQSIY